MEISALFRRLSYGELSNLSIAEEGGTLAERKHPQIIQYANEGLLELYSRFVLKERSLVLELSSHVLNYHLMKEYAESSNSSEVRHRYIKDCAEQPFKNDVIRILEVWDEDGCRLPLNDKDNPESLFTPQPTMLQVNKPEDGVQLAVVYQARHRVLSDNADRLLDQKITLPFSLEGALQNFIAHKVYSHMNGQENIVKGQEYLAAYEAICLGVEQRDLVSQSHHTSHTKLEQRGFV